jgi:hypothetical protein
MLHIFSLIFLGAPLPYLVEKLFEIFGVWGVLILTVIVFLYAYKAMKKADNYDND